MPGLEKEVFGKLESSRDFLNLLSCDIPEEVIANTFEYDYLGKYAGRGGDHRAGYGYRVLAARSFEMKGDKKFLRDAAFAYDRAAKSAEMQGCIEAAIRCRVRACKIYDEMGKAENGNAAQEHIRRMADFYAPDEIVGERVTKERRFVPERSIKSLKLGEDAVAPHKRTSAMLEIRKGKPEFRPRVREAYQDVESDSDLDERVNGNKKGR